MSFKDLRLPIIGGNKRQRQLNEQEAERKVKIKIIRQTECFISLLKLQLEENFVVCHGIESKKNNERYPTEMQVRVVNYTDELSDELRVLMKKQLDEAEKKIKELKTDSKADEIINNTMQNYAGKKEG